jgi:hypothetical protein
MNLMLGAIDGGQVVEAIIWLVVAGLVYWILDWALKKVALPEPFNKVATVLLILLVVVVVINALFLLIGKPFIKW